MPPQVSPQGGGAVVDAPDLAELERRAVERGPAYGEGAHIVCDNLVRIYKSEGIEVVALQCRSMAGTTDAPSTELTFTNIKRHMHRALSDPDLSPASAAAACRISVRTLHRLFARHAQLSFEAYVLQARLALAYETLRAGRAQTVSEVAFACGFNNLSHFTRRFAERYGELPVNLLKQTRSNT